MNGTPIGLEFGKMSVNHGLPTFDDQTDLARAMAPDRAALMNDTEYTGAVRLRYLEEGRVFDIPARWELLGSIFHERPEFVDAHTGISRFLTLSPIEQEEFKGIEEMNSWSITGRLQTANELFSLSGVSHDGNLGVQGGIALSEGGTTLTINGGFRDRGEQNSQGISVTLKNDWVSFDESGSDRYLPKSGLIFSPYIQFTGTNGFFEPVDSISELVDKRSISVGMACRYILPWQDSASRSEFSNEAQGYMECIVVPEIELLDYANDSSGKYNEKPIARLFTGFTVRF